MSPRQTKCCCTSGLSLTILSLQYCYGFYVRPLSLVYHMATEPQTGREDWFMHHPKPWYDVSKDKASMPRDNQHRSASG